MSIVAVLPRFYSPLLLALLLSGCAGTFGLATDSPEAAKVQAPHAGVVETRRVVSGDPAQVLQRAVARVKSNKRYKLEGAGSNPLTLSLSGDPLKYIDCGEVVIPASDGRAAARFPAAQASHQYALPIKGRIYGVTRKLQMQAQAELKLESQGAGQSRATVSVEYRLKRQQRAVADGVAPVVSNDELLFRSGETATFPNAPTRCAANGKLEDELLDLLH